LTNKSGGGSHWFQNITRNNQKIASHLLLHKKFANAVSL